MTLDTHASFFAATAAREYERSVELPGSIAIGGLRCVQRVSGEIDLQTTVDFSGALDRLLFHRPDRILLDLTGVSFLSASGLLILARFCGDAAAANVPVAVATSRAVARPIVACGLASKVDIYDTVEAATAALETPIA